MMLNNLKTRIGPDGLHLFNRYNGLNILLDEVKLPSNEWSKAPRQVSIALTNACNLRCPHCYAPKHPSVLDYDRLTQWLKQQTNPNSGVTQYAYDSNDRVTSITDPKGLITTYGYDGLDNLTSIQSPDTGTTTKTYDSAGNVLTSTDAKSQTTTYTYDALNRRSSATLSGGGVVTFTYDQGTNGIGHLTSMSDSSGSRSWTYDQKGRVTQQQQTVGAVTLTTGYSYDTYGRLASMTYPSGKVVSLTYDAGGRVSGMSTGGNTLLEQIVYMPFGPVSSWVWGNGGSYGRSYDADGRVSAISIVGTTQVPGTRTITPAYDTASRITQIADTAATTKDYGYDSLDRLLSYSATPTTHSYSYDANGNRLGLTTDGGSSTYTYATSPASNRLESVSGQQVRTNSHDLNGSLTGDGVNSYTYDARGRMASVTAGGLTTSYGVNGLGQRVSKAGSGVQPSGALVYAYDEAGHLIGEYDGVTGAAEQETVWLGDLPVAVLTGDLTSPAVYNVHPDHLNAPKVITDQIGNTVWNWDHDPFGNGQPTGTLTYNLRFPGQYYDVETGLNYNMNRDYDPVLGRYVQSDPIGLEGGINTYGYVGQNPLWATDPLGLFLLPGEQSVSVRGGSPTQQQAVKEMLNRILSTPRGKELEEMVRGPWYWHGSPKTVHLNCEENNSALLGGGDIYLDPTAHPVIQTTEGAQPASTQRILAHELGHAVTGTGDTGSDRMGNVSQNENPISRSLGEPYLRTRY